MKQGGRAGAIAGRGYTLAVLSASEGEGESLAVVGNFPSDRRPIVRTSPVDGYAGRARRRFLPQSLAKVERPPDAIPAELLSEP